MVDEEKSETADALALADILLFAIHRISAR
jgi:hypothetical protein